MGNLLLNSLEIRNFRGFRHLQIERLGRVNLIVGKNNIGKSSLLEALQLYARRGVPAVIWEMLDARDEDKLPRPIRYSNTQESLLALGYLFYGRKKIAARANVEPIKIGPMSTPDDVLSIAMRWSTLQTRVVDEVTGQEIEVPQSERSEMVTGVTPYLDIQLGKRAQAVFPLDPSISLGIIGEAWREINCIFIGAYGLNREKVGELWDHIALTDLEHEVLVSLRLVAPGIEGLNIINSPTAGAERTAIVRIADIDGPLPIRSLGDGIQRVLGIALALANAKDGMLLVDEIENGIHYSVQQDLWDFILRLAGRLNVQVFATTHNWDCIEAFQKAAQEAGQEEALLIRLGIKKDEIVATLFDERRLEIATREQIEVR